MKTNAPKYLPNTYVEVKPLNGKDDFGNPLRDYVLEQISRGHFPYENIQRLSRDSDGKIVYNFAIGSFYENKLSDKWQWEPEKSGFAEEIFKKVSDEIKSYQRKINDLQNEISDLKEGKESKELKELRNLADDLAKKLAKYADGSVRIVGDQNLDDCSGNYLKWGMQAKCGLNNYITFHRNFSLLPNKEVEDAYCK